MKLLSYDSFKSLDAVVALSIIHANVSESPSTISSAELENLLTPFDLKRLESYADSLLDYHVVLDLAPTLATLYFRQRLGPDFTMSPAQQAILLALGLQRKPVEAMQTELGLTSSQTLALFGKILRRLSGRLEEIRRSGVEQSMPDRSVQDGSLLNGSVVNGRPPLEQTVEEELNGSMEGQQGKRKRGDDQLVDSS